MACFNVKLWQAAWESELQFIIDQDTFNKPIIVPKRHNAIIAQVVWDMKYVEYGNIARYKACLLAHGFNQIYDVDYEETFALTICYDAFHIFLAIATKNH